MIKHHQTTALADVLQEVGLSPCAKFYRDPHFLVAVFAAVPVLWLIHGWAPVFTSRHDFHWGVLLSIILWQPFVEELLFRGVIQGQFSKTLWARQALFKITTANLVTSLLFVGMHMLNNLPTWSLMIILPSLVFGYFRDRYNSVYPSMVLHGCYNAMVIAGLWLSGMLVIQPMAS
jgi:hypothetical protein